MNVHTTTQPAYEGIQTTSSVLAGTDQPPNTTFADPQLSQQFEIDQDGLENHEGDLFFYEFNMDEEFRRLEMMKELERRRLWAQHQQPSDEDEEYDEGEEEEEDTNVSFCQSRASNPSYFSSRRRLIVQMVSTKRTRMNIRPLGGALTGGSVLLNILLSMDKKKSRSAQSGRHK
jgi:hypothetical protein